MTDRDRWRVMRQDDNGNEFLVGTHATRERAEEEAARLEARGHKQTYWVESEAPAPSTSAPARSSQHSSTRAKRVLSIQSFVSHGRVGNSVATFALQRQGVEVCPLHTVTYSSHLGYEGWRGEATSVALLESLLEGLGNLSLWARTDAVLTGFLKDRQRADVAIGAVRRAREHGVLPWVCDPVLGDQGRMYVEEAMIDVYREVLSEVDVLTPNASELGWLSKMDLSTPSQASVLAAASAIAGMLREGGWVIAKGWQLDATDQKQLELFLVSRERRYKITAPRWPRGFAGAGDLFAACITAGLVEGKAMRDVVVEATCKVASILEITWRSGADELELIRAQRLLEQTSREDVSLIEL